MARKNVTVIPATLNLHTRAPKNASVKRRVAGYARVSTDSEEQLTSYEAQVDYYTKYIQGRSDWQFVGVYTDEGISAVMTKHRDGFNKMIEDALSGKIDLIVTKSVSRFARNTVDSLITVRKLKEKGVEVYFEKENIYTLDSKGELLITIMSSLAQEESRSISENVTWGRRKQFADGKVSLPYGRFLGYEKGPDGLPKIIPEQAKIVVYIYDLFMMGLTPGAIARRLTAEGIPTPGGKTNWADSTVKSILTNEKYKGDALLQKEFTVDFLQKKMKQNEGEIAQYYVEDSHPAIISKELFDRVQAEFQRRKNLGLSNSCTSIFSARIICSDCGGFYGMKVWNSNNKYRRVIWQCNHKYRGTKCTTPHLSEEEIYSRFLTAFNSLLANKEALIDDCRLMYDYLTDTEELDRQIISLQNELEVIVNMTRRYVAENATKVQSQTDYGTRYKDLTDRYEKLIAQLQETEQTRQSRLTRSEDLSSYIKTIENRAGELTEFDPRLWLEVIDTATVHHNGSITFRFADGRELTV